MMSEAPSVLYIRHDPEADPGVVGARLADHGFVGEDLPVVQSMDRPNPVVEFGDPRRFDLIVPLGCIFSVHDTDRIGNWIGAELEFLADAQRHDIPILGICFGGQALAAALGATVEVSPDPEVGWVTVDSDLPEALAPGPWMQWHFDRFEVPSGATEVARTDHAPQAYTIGRSLGLQFHPEVTADLVNGWLDGAPPEELEKPGIAVDQIREDSNRLAPQAAPRTARLVDWFLSDVAKLR